MCFCGANELRSLKLSGRGGSFCEESSQVEAADKQVSETASLEKSRFIFGLKRRAIIISITARVARLQGVV